MSQFNFFLLHQRRSTNHKKIIEEGIVYFVKLKKIYIEIRFNKMNFKQVLCRDKFCPEIAKRNIKLYIYLFVKL